MLSYNYHMCVAIIITYISVYFNVKNLREIIILFLFCLVIFLLKCVIILVFVYMNVIVKQVRSLLPSPLVFFLFPRHS